MIKQQNVPAGPSPAGQWTDMRSGEVVTVKTMVDDMTGSGAQIMFSDNRVIPFKEFSMYYIQEDDAARGSQMEDTGPQKEQSYLNKDLLMSGLTPPEPAVTAKRPLNLSAESPESKERQMVIDLLKKSKIKPSAVLDGLTLAGIEPVKMLIDYFDITVDDIADALVSEYINKETIKEKVKEILMNQNGKE